jgi:hypothetical protein
MCGDFVSSFRPLRENARRSSCRAISSKFSLGMLQYQQDYYGYFPPVAGARRALSKRHKKAREDSVLNAPECSTLWLGR